MGRFFVWLLVFLLSSRVDGQSYLKSKYGNSFNASPSPSYPQSGVKTSHVKTKTAPSHGYAAGPPPSPANGATAYRGGCTSKPPPILNAATQCSAYSGCRATCDVGYQFPNGAFKTAIICENGEWRYEDGIWGQRILACQPRCDPECQNNGFCEAPNQCNCPPPFLGPQCQFEDKPCMNRVPSPMNARRHCSDKFCTVSCTEGYQFPDGTGLATLVCKNGFWVPTKEKWSKIPDCEPTCTPPCLNGGSCLSLNHCQCPQSFRGPQCQYRQDNCASTKLRFNGGYNCAGDSIGVSCSINCPEGMELKFKPARAYYCRYKDGFFVPGNIPQCLSKTPVRVVSSHRYGNSSSFNINTLSVNGNQEWDSNHQQYKYNVPGNEIYGKDLKVVTLPPNIVVTKLPEPGICFTWQGSHYKTFDGKVYSFDSKCAHTLVKDAADNTFSIVIQNHPQCSDAPSNCFKIIKIYLDQKQYVLTRSKDGVPVFSTPKKILPIPGQLPGLRIEMAAHFVILSLDSVGVTLRWDNQQQVQVEVKENLWNRTEGLCGRIDGVDSNDLLNKNGYHSQTITNLAVSWKIEDLESECDDLPSEEHKCHKVEYSKSLEGTLFCQRLFNDKRFAACKSAVDANSVLEACRWDYCSCQSEDPTTCACETMSVFIKICSYKGVKDLAAWRDATTCPMQCSGGRTYKPCGPSGGQPVCGASVQESEGCVEGCYCPEGTVLHENRCISRAECPCKLRKKIFAPGSEVPKDCNTCTCIEGKWVCTRVSCGARCAAIGDPHYTTFDGKKYDFMGQCNYYLVKSRDFSVEAENVACSGAISQAMNLPASISSGLPSCTRAVTLRISGQAIKLKQNHDIVVNGQDITKVPYTIANVTIRSVSSIFLQVELPNGILIWWDGVTRVYIDIPADFSEATQGLCGTFNNNQKDDFLTPEGDIEASIIPFANKWKTSEKCNDIPDTLTSHPCSTNIHHQATAEEHCRRIRGDLFAPCHFLVDPETYYQDCLYDLCACEHKIAKCLCPTLAAYAEECSRKGVKINWRDSVRECGLHCPSGQKYQICGNTCTRTCLDMALRPDCKPQCVEGCNCAEGEALSDEGECVPVGDCKCHFDGLFFEAGYKEVRPASKGLQLCTCINAQWSCREAAPGDAQKYPKASDLRSLCGLNMEFTSCEPAEPVTCRNMHSVDYFSASVCHPGCKCKEDYVLDSTTKKCVRPEECPCHHGGRSYKENATVQDDCNTCRCQNGKWTCTDRPCAAECSAWGDSHFRTFDGKHYDFQGQCDYALAKGLLDTASFDISIQNVPCGSLGTSCSKSITIRIKSGEAQDSITLTRDKPLPNHEEMKHATLRQKGLYVIVEAPDLGLVVQWDKGTRVYVKVDPRWKDRVKGLCGNYNDDDGDDFQTPSGGINEVSAKIFGDSWKLQPYCPEALEITNTCEDRPDRKVWALKQCGVLKSSLFSRCHSEVPVDIYLEKCVFDSCACDQGGDCECLCTALAAYAQECNNRGVPIKWRSQKLCPIQCDERCSTYSPCITTCPLETCDNSLTHHKLSKTCKQNNCIEGCDPKPCPHDHIYLNSSFLECVPRNICKPVCLEIDKTVYYEGDLIEEDECHSCFCSRGQKSCKGQPCTTTIAPILTTHQLEQITKCESGWTRWINQDKAKPTKSRIARKKTDYEPIPTALILNNLKGAKCDKDKITNIECRTVKTHRTPKETGLDVECSLENGLICKSSQKGKWCLDFEIRVFCECEKLEECDTLKPHKEHPTDCHKFYHCEPGFNGTKFVEKTCGPSMYFNPVSMVCDWPYAVEEIKPECKKITTLPPPTEPVQVTQTYGGLDESFDNILEKELDREGFDLTVCPIGTKSDCAIRCDNLCLFYSYMVKASGFCEEGKSCEPGCITPGQNATCPLGMMWANNETCVAIHDCLCRSNDGRPVKPGATYRESDCRICQCVDNTYYCDESACHTTAKPQGHKRPVGEIGLPPTTPESSEEESGRKGHKEIAIISTVTPPQKCDEDRFVDLIQGDEPLPDEAFNASSVLSSAFLPEHARFSVKAEGKSGGSWAPAYSNTFQFLQVDLGRQEPVYGVRVKGSPLYDEYVTSYKVTYSPDGKNFLAVLNKNRLPQTFRGSIDSRTPVQEIFDTPFEAKIVRIHPQTWHTAISLKVELIGCGEPITTSTVLYEFITTTTPKPVMCDDAMGLDDGTLSDQQVSTSSRLDSNHDNPKLSDDSSWQPLTNSPTEFIQFDFLETRNLTGVETKGGPNGWVTAYTVKYSHDGKEWNPVLDKSAQERVFVANFDSDSPRINHFDLPINARYLKLIPNKWQDNIQMRVEVHGCYEPYPTVEEVVSTTTALPSPCNNCIGITSESMELEACRCPTDEFWDGEKCVVRTECPCIVGHISYAVGTVYEKEDCSQCICKLGGVAHCTPKQCAPCENGLRSTVTTTCKCTCQPCPNGTVLCPTSNICINSTLWCNGVRDCPDDETGCTTVTVPPITTTPIPVKKCPVVECPRGYKKQLKTTRRFNFYSPMFLQDGSVKHSNKNVYSGLKTSKGNRKGNLAKPSNVKVGIKKSCPEYKCIPDKPPPKYIIGKKECPPVSCPLNYIAIYDEEPVKTKNAKTKECPRYTCYPPPPPDAVCNVTGRTFNTFDETEYKYDICNHILARDLKSDDWQISLEKNCTESCSRNLVVHHDDHSFVLHPDLTVEFDGFRYTIEQTKKIGSQARAFSISRLGNTLLFVSNQFGFWVIWDKLGDVKIGVAHKLVERVDGLCGFFSENGDDDKRKPDGSLARTTAEFGDSWRGDGGQNCETKTCPMELQEKAWKACRVKDQALEPCSKIVNIDAFVSRCVETTCDCFLAAGKNQTAQEECRCDALESLVVDCLTADSTIDLSDWRMRLNCPVTCEAPLVYHDCYQRRCEPTCESITDPNVCPKIPHVCFPGCYCPAGFVKKGETCIKPSSCRDCECNVLPHLQYVTYDDRNFTVNANCVYVMSRDAILRGGEHKFQVLITNAPCQNNQKKTCVGKVTILYENRKIHVLHDAFRRNLRLIVDGERIDDFSELEPWSRVAETATKHLKMLLTDVQVEVSVYYPSLGVSVKAPSHKYGGRLEGLCGDCNDDADDDFETPGGELVEDVDEFAASWLYDKLPGGQSREQCENKPEICPPLPEEDDPCKAILDYKTFGQCLRVLDPGLFLEWCKKDTCDSHPEFACASIEAYARDCANSGFCVNWRTNLCPARDCPSDQVYDPCGTKCPQTCDSIKIKKSCSDKPVEGCFCPDGMVLRNATCVFEKDCEVCDEEGHHPGDRWKQDKCTDCVCDGLSLKCETRRCSGADQICEDGFQAVKVPSKEDECCDKYACVPEPTAGPTCETPQPISCANDQITKLSQKPNGCQQFICVCKPKEECEPVDISPQNLDDGYVREVDESGCCPQIKTICKPELCPKPKACPQYHTLKNESTAKCCPFYSCEAPKDKCIYENRFVSAETGGERERTQNERQKFLKNANDTWEDGPCHFCRCSLTSIGNYQAECAQTDCTIMEVSNDHLDYDYDIRLVYDQCCPEIKRSACKHNETIYKIGESWIDGNDPCTTYKCSNTSEGVRKEIKTTNCDTNCEIGFEYVSPTNSSEQCCGLCKPYACVVGEDIYLIGSQWEAEDHCTKYKCVKIEGALQIQSHIVTCPELPEDYINDFVFETIPIDGECCKKHKITACKVGDKIYQIGESWPSPDGDRCKKYTCAQHKLEITKQESIESCKTDCSLGWEYRNSNETCCGQCVQVACLVNGTVLKKPGEKWTSFDGCTTYICENFDNQFVVSSNQESCPSIDSCPEKHIQLKGCCKVCNITTEAQKLCSAQDISLNKTIGLLKIHRGEHGLCTNKKPIQSFSECIGTCQSSTMFNFVKGFHESVCSCCKATDYESLEVDLECDDGYSFKKKIVVPSECGCEGCAAAKKFTKTSAAVKA